jgi:hypothetical protein
MTTTNLLGPSHRQKESNVGIIDGSILTVGSGLIFTHLRGMPDEVKKSDVNNVAWGDRNEDIVQISIDPVIVTQLIEVFTLNTMAIVSDYATLVELTTTSGDIVSQIPSLTSYATLVKLTTTSGDIVSQIPSLTNYVTVTQLDTVSGNAVSTAEAYTTTMLSGYTGSIVVSGSVTLTVINGLITTYA